MSEKVSAGVDLDALEQFAQLDVWPIGIDAKMTSQGELVWRSLPALIVELRAARAVVEAAGVAVNQLMLEAEFNSEEAIHYGLTDLVGTITEYDRLTGERQ